MYTGFFENPDILNYMSVLSLVPTGRCSDGKFRSFFDYLDFLLPDPTIDVMVEASNKLSRVFVTTLDFSTPNSITIRMNRS